MQRLLRALRRRRGPRGAKATTVRLRVVVVVEAVVGGAEIACVHREVPPRAPGARQAVLRRKHRRRYYGAVSVARVRVVVAVRTVRRGARRLQRGQRERERESERSRRRWRQSHPARRGGAARERDDARRRGAARRHRRPPRGYGRAGARSHRRNRPRKHGVWVLTETNKVLQQNVPRQRELLGQSVFGGTVRYRGYETETDAQAARPRRCLSSICLDGP